MPDMRHVLVPWAYLTTPGCDQALSSIRLPHLKRLLARCTLTHQDRGDESARSLPHERALARLLGLEASDGATPWAAWERAQAGHADATDKAWAFISPCHWQVGTDHITMTDSRRLQLDEASSRALLDLLSPWFAEDGMTLHFDRPDRWLAQGQIFESLRTASLQRVLQRDVRNWMPNATETRTLHRLQSEVQMLLYNHDWNARREADGLLPVNAFWVHGAGRCAALPKPGTLPQVLDHLRHSVLRQDWASWTVAWQAIDAGPLAELLTHIEAGGHASLTLSGENSALQWSTHGTSWLQRAKHIFQPIRIPSILSQL